MTIAGQRIIEGAKEALVYAIRDNHRDQIDEEGSAPIFASLLYG